MAHDEDNPEATSRQDQAVAARLRKLSTFPLDLSGLERQVRAQIPQAAAERHWPTTRMHLLRPLTAVAASILVLAVIAAAVLTATSGEVMASPAQMAKFHREIVSNPMGVTKVDSIARASQVLAEQWPQGPGLPHAPEAHVMACCMKSVKNKKMACVLLSSEGTPITMSVANASDMRSPAGGKKVTHGGASFHVVSAEGLSMVSTERNGRWVCLIGETPAERLIAITQQLQF
jgi:hypothetical protein